MVQICRRVLSLARRGAAIIAVIGLTVLLDRVTTDLLRANHARELAWAARQLADRLDHEMYERWRDINVAAALDTLEGGAIQSRRRVLDQLQAAFPLYAWIGFTDLSGTVAASTNGMLEGVDVSKRPWFGQGLEGPSVLQVHEAKLLAGLLGGEGADGSPLRFVDIAAPLRDGAGKVTGVLGAHLDWAWATDMRRSVLGGDAGEPARDGMILDAEGGVLLAFRETSGGGASDGGGPWLEGRAATQGYRDYPGLGWTVVVREGPDALGASVGAMRRNIYQVGLASAGLIALVGLLAGRPRPIAKAGAAGRVL